MGNENFTEPPARASLFQERVFEVSRVQQTLLDEKLPEGAPREARRDGHDRFCIGNSAAALK